MASRMISLKEIEVKKSMLKSKTIFAAVFVPVISLGSLEKNDMKKVHNVKAKASLKLLAYLK